MVQPTPKCLAFALSKLEEFQTIVVPEDWPTELIEQMSVPVGVTVAQQFGNPLLQEPLSKSSSVVRMRSKATLGKALRHNAVSVNQVANNVSTGLHGRFIGVKGGLVVYSEQYSNNTGIPFSTPLKYKWDIMEFKPTIIKTKDL